MNNKFSVAISACAVLLLTACQPSSQTQSVVGSKVDCASGKNQSQPKGAECKKVTAQHQRDHGDGFADRYWFIDEYDQDGDGQLTRAEFDAARAARLVSMDINKDGRIDETEYVDEYALRLERKISEERKAQVKQTVIRFASVDSDKDGKMTWAEYEASGPRAFNFLDKSGRGVIDAQTPQPENRAPVQTVPEIPRQRSALSMPSSHSVSGFIALYDNHGDGQVTREEFTAERQASFKATDTNGDQWISAEEYLLEFENRLDLQAKQVRTGQLKQAHIRFGALDRDKDGDLTLQEFAASGDRIFSGWDVNNDGVVNVQDPLPNRQRHADAAKKADARQKKSQSVSAVR
jgi:Ca2+-binding EF-hand superfamily protein